MADHKRATRSSASSGSSQPAEGAGRRPTCTCNMKTANFAFGVLLAFTAGFFLMTMLTKGSWTTWAQSPLPFLSSGSPPARRPPSPRFSPNSSEGSPSASAPPQAPDEDFAQPESFKSFVKRQGGNFSGVAEYLSSVRRYLLAFRSPMIREDPAQYSWPVQAGRGKARGESPSNTKRVVHYNPPSFFVSAVRKTSVFDRCPVKDCVFSLNYKKDHSEADAVVFHGAPGRAVPARDHADQVYVFMIMESPVHVSSSYSTLAWNTAFNWTWNYRTDSDIFEPVGYLKRSPSVPSVNTLFNLKQQKQKYVAWMSSNCNVQSKRDQYVKRLRKIIPVDIYGRCGELSCERNEPKCKTVLNDYMFYLSFENSMCVDYITEKYYKTFTEGVHVLSVVRGGGNYSRFFPSGTFIDAEAFSSPEELGHYLLGLAQNEAEYVDMLWRRAHFVYHEHGILDTFCQLCYKLHHLDRFKRAYSDLHGWHHAHRCSSPKPF